MCVKTARLCVYVCLYKNARALFFSLFIMWRSLLFVVAAFHFFARREEMSRECFTKNKTRDRFYASC